MNFSNGGTVQNRQRWTSYLRLPRCRCHDNLSEALRNALLAAQCERLNLRLPHSSFVMHA